MIRTIAIDDEPLALQLLTGCIKRTPFLELAGEFDNPFSAMEFLQKEPVDLMFLDIQMPDLTGTELVKILKDGPRLVFVTAYERYALESFKLNAVDYILKPYSYEEFLQAAVKAQHLIELENRGQEQIGFNADFLFIKSEYKVRRIRFDKILYIEGLKDYIKVFVDGEPKPILSIGTLKTLEAKLPSSKFMRVHRSFIVNLDKIETIERSRIIFGKEYIPIGDQYKVQFQAFLDKNFL
ncbi:MAG: LytTR family DNA-binding domain-containing protein [Bacteroidales bacterium]|nr:LytTR family DNA-binding domain-containing protein [Bacteroidales bacterium]